MTQFASPTTLRRVAKAKKKDLIAWREGLNLEQSTGHSIEELRQRTTADRWRLAQAFRQQGDRMMAARPPLYRVALGRFYYSMYHSMRAVVFFTEGGDDYEAHAMLPRFTPSDFPQSSLWQNALKNARTQRNAADYDAYPKSDRAYRPGALELQSQAIELEKLSREYLTLKGCGHL